MKASLARSCLLCLEDSELEDILEAGEFLRLLVRKSASGKSAGRVDAGQFRRWIRLPKKSGMLGGIPQLFAEGLEVRAEEGEVVEQTPGVRALIALGSPSITSVEGFAAVLADIRSGGQTGTDVLPDQPATSADDAVRAEDLAGDVSAETDDGVDAAAIAALHDELVAAGEDLAEALQRAVAAVQVGHAVEPEVGDALAAWSDLRTSIWVAIGESEPASHLGVADLAQVRDERAAAEEAARQAAEEAARRAAADEARRVAEERMSLLAELSARREKLRLSIPAIEFLVESDEADRPYLDKIVGQLKQVEAEIRALETASDESNAAGPAAEEGGRPSPSDSERPQVVPETEVPETDVPETEVPETEVPETEVPETPLMAAPADDGDESFADSWLTEIVDQVTTTSDGHDAESPMAADLAISPASDDSDERARVVHPEHSEPSADVPDEEIPAAHAGIGTGDVEAALALHIDRGHFGAAWVIAKAAGMPEPDVEAYRIAAAAFHSSPGRIDPSMVLNDISNLTSESGLRRQSARVVLAAELRAALVAGWIPRQDGTQSEAGGLVRWASLGEHGRVLRDAVVEAMDRDYKHRSEQGVWSGQTTDDVRRRAGQLREELDETTRTKYVRADKVLLRLMRKQEPLGNALDVIEADTGGEDRRAALKSALAALQSPDKVISAADYKESTPQQRRREKIIKGARNTLLRSIASVSELLTEALNAELGPGTDSRESMTQAARSKLVGAAGALVDSGELEAGRPGDQAFAQLVSWIQRPGSPGYSAAIDVLLVESLPALSAPRDDDGLPATGGDFETIAAELAAPGTAEKLFAAYAGRGDLQQATSAARSDSRLLPRLDEHREEWVRRLRAEVAALRAEIGKTFANEFSEGQHSDAEARLVIPDAYGDADGEDRFDLQMSDLSKLREDLAAHRDGAAARLRARALEEISRAGDRDRILQLIDAGDLVTANELLSLALVGPLPDVSAVRTDGTSGAAVFDQFMDDLRRCSPSGNPRIHDVVQQLGGRLAPGVDGGHKSPNLNAWDQVASKRRKSQERRATVSSILSELGLDVRGDINEPSTAGGNYSLYRVSASPADGSLVPGLGSKATHYMVLVTNDADLLVRQALVSAFPDNSGPNIVLFDGVLTKEQRRRCLDVCRRNQTTAIVVDHAVAAFVALHHRRSFKTVQQLTLPFTCFTHYTLVSGHVPDEVFVGRNSEQRKVAARDGSLFVYGGRQLGKTALLKRTAREFNAVDDQHAIYIDLNVHGIGQSTEPQQLWQVLYNELVGIGSMKVKRNPNVRTPGPVIGAIRSWLAGKETRRLLVLLDEADAFLEKESVAGTDGFKHIQPLKGLFDESEGRFKPVFAGLHRVQRLQNVANTPLAHGGSDVLIGPLAASPAYELVVRPLEALGYRFADDNLVWRLLAFTNMQPGLIQLVCDQLVNQLQSRPLRRDEPLVVITADDVDEVTQNERTRGAIADKLRLTIDLEVRYRVIALAIAIMCMENQFREHYSAADIRLHCEFYWPDGFSGLNTEEFIAHLEELKGLGVLAKDAEGHYSVRSPNIVTMLGTKEQLETTLTEAEFELEHEYNPRSTRRPVQIGSETRRSPLSEHQLSRLLPLPRQNRHDPRNFIIAGSVALGVDRVVPTLAVVADERRIALRTVDGTDPDAAAQISELKFTGGGTHRPTFLVVDATACDRDQVSRLEVAVRARPPRTQGHLVVVYGSAGAARAANSLGNESETGVIALDKWSGDGIRSWTDNPFRNDPGDRRRLLAATGGWPDLVDRAVLEADRGSGNVEVCGTLMNFPETVDEARAFLELAGVGEAGRARLVDWAAYELDEYESLDDVSDILGYEREEAREFLAPLCLLGVVDERDDAYLLDPVVERALRVTSESGADS